MRQSAGVGSSGNSRDSGGDSNGREANSSFACSDLVPVGARTHPVSNEFAVPADIHIALLAVKCRMLCLFDIPTIWTVNA